jgi:hypothetical protein
MLVTTVLGVLIVHPQKGFRRCRSTDFGIGRISNDVMPVAVERGDRGALWSQSTPEKPGNAGMRAMRQRSARVVNVRARSLSQPAER